MLGVREIIRQGANDPVLWEVEVTKGTKLCHFSPFRRRSGYVVCRKDSEKLRKFDSDTDTALLDTDRSTQDTLF